MNQDKNDVALADAPNSVDGQQVVHVLQVSISDNAAEDSYKVLLADGSATAVPMTDFTAGSTVNTDDTATVAAVEQPQAQAVQAVEQPTQPTQPPTVGGQV